ncbi:MAG: transaldolase family protein [Caldilineaceae bacterium]|nr:transaldolase family protein [Caldilineaceae bacterium]MBP8107905.1 transaldolase family protein [Caldilineaceae bacterium]MBP8123791.1 transaldolase family protein [Caldilineaceae bacterium]MBP9073584.1 transaldolase family protein [Caldilineaceae bacterium]
MATSSPLLQTVSTTPTDYWNDSCSKLELTYAIGHGAVGATTNPNIVLNVLNQEMDLWEARIHAIIAENPTWSEGEIAWKLNEEMAVFGAGLLAPAFARNAGRKGRISIQTNPMYYRNAEAIVEQARHFATLAPNMQVKMPVTEAGVRAVEEATYHGVNVNATVSFTVPQAIAVAEAVERGLDRRAAEGLDNSGISPVCTIMIGRTDDWMKVVTKRDNIDIDPDYLNWAGIAVFKNAYDLYQKRGYRTRLLAAAYRHLGHWSELIGGDVVLTIPYEWQLKINASDIPVVERIHTPVDPTIVRALYGKIPDFRRAYDPDGMTPAEFDSYGACVRTLRSFITAVHDLMGVVREFMLPNPDV